MIGAVGFPVVVLVQVVVSNSAMLDASAVSLIELDPQAAEVVVNRLSRVPELVAAKEVVPVLSICAPHSHLRTPASTGRGNRKTKW